jgi:hypothetical protein
MYSSTLVNVYIEIKGSREPVYRYFQQDNATAYTAD